MSQPVSQQVSEWVMLLQQLQLPHRHRRCRHCYLAICATLRAEDASMELVGSSIKSTDGWGSHVRSCHVMWLGEEISGIRVGEM